MRQDYGSNLMSRWGAHSERKTSPIRELASILFSREANMTNTQMIFLRAYFDETGSGSDFDCKFCGMTGCLSIPTMWDEFDPKWKAILDSEGLEYFHMTDFAASEGQFKEGWKDNEPRRRSLLSRLWDVLEEAMPFFIGVVIPMEHYRDKMHELHQALIRDAYYVAYKHCLDHIAGLLSWDHASDVAEVATVFDNKKGFKGLANDIHDIVVEKNGLGSVMSPPAFRDMRKYRPLQAADMVAYELFKEYDRRLHSPARPPRWGFKRLESIVRKSLPEGDLPFVFYTEQDVIDYDNQIREALDKIMYERHGAKRKEL
jgi:hypothetical protein